MLQECSDWISAKVYLEECAVSSLSKESVGQRQMYSWLERSWHKLQSTAGFHSDLVTSGFPSEEG